MKTTANHMSANHVGVRGWLLVFCLVLILLNPVATMVNLSTSFKISSPYFALYPGLKIITVMDGILSFGIVCFSVYAGISLWRIRPSGIAIAKMFLLTFLGYAVVANTLPFLAGLPSNANEAMLAQAFIGILRSTIIVSVWYLYLVRSKRVRATFPATNVSGEQDTTA